MSEIASLREQNQKLQVVITQMKDDMESLTTNARNRPDSNGLNEGNGPKAHNWMLMPTIVGPQCMTKRFMRN